MGLHLKLEENYGSEFPLNKAHERGYLWKYAINEDLIMALGGEKAHMNECLILKSSNDLRLIFLEA